MIENEITNSDNKYVKDMTEGEPLCLLFSFAIPLFIGNLFQQAYNLTDSIIVGRYIGKVALGAVGSTGIIMIFINSLTVGLSVGIGIIIAQFYGAREDFKVKNSIGNSFYLVGISAGLMSILGFTLAGPILNLLHTPKVTFPFAVLYLKTISLGFISTAFFNLLSSILRALGDSKTPLRFLIVACIFNIVLDLLFVTKFNIGVFGVGLATALSQLIASCLCLIYAIVSNSYFRLQKSDFNFNLNLFYKVVGIGIPVAGQNSLIAFSLIALQRVVNEFGADFVTAFIVVSRIELFIQHPLSSLGAALATYTGQNIGAGKYNRVKLGYHKACMCTTVFAIFVFIVFQNFAHFFVEIFSKDKTVVNFAVIGLKITCSFYIFLGFIHTTRSVLNGAGDAKFCFFNGIVECIGRVCFAKPLTMIKIIGLNGIWLTTGITWLLTSIFSILRYRQGKWKNISLIKTDIVSII